MPKGSQLTTRKALGKPLGKIDFLGDNDNDDILLDAPWVLPPPLKNLVNVSVRKLFALDLDLKAVEGNSAQEKLKKIRSLFSGINGFGRASTPSKFSGIIRATFIFELGLMKATEKATGANIMVNTDLKRSSERLDWAVVIKEIPIGTSAKAVCTALSEFGVIKTIKMQLIGLWQKADLVAAEWSILIGKDAVCVARADSDKEVWDIRDQHRALLYTLPMGTNAHDIWDFVRSVGGKMCVIDCHSVTYAWARCAVVCFDSVESLDAAVGTTPVLRNTNLHWASLISAKCAKCEKLGHTSLGCAVSGKLSSGSLLRRVFSDVDKSRLATIYTKCLALVARLVSFGGLSWAKIARGCFSPPLSGQNIVVNNGSSSKMKPSQLVAKEVDDRFATLEHSLASLVEQVGKLAKRLDALGPTVPQLSPGCQPLVTPSSQDQGADVVMSEGLGVSPSGGNITGMVSFDMSSHEVSDEDGSGPSAKVDSIVWRVAMCNIRGMNNPAKQEDIIRWHKEMNNLVSIITEMKLKNKFDGVRVFSSGLDSGHLGAGVAVIMDISLAHHVCKVSEVPGRLLSIKLLFKGKLSVSILGLYAGASLVVRFSQAGEVNSLIAKAVNESSFIILGGDFNEDSSHRSASFKRCFDLGLVNSLVSSAAAKMPTWENSRGVKKTIDYVFVSSSLVNAIVRYEVLNVSEHFDMDHQAVSVDLGLGGLLDTRLNSLHKQANKDHWKFNVKSVNRAKWLEFRDVSAANVSMFSDAFGVAVRFSDIVVLSAGGLFKKKWFKGFDGMFTKISSRFHKLELLVFKLVKALHLASSDGFASLLEVWHRLDSPGALVVKSLFLSGSNFDLIRSALVKARKSYHSFKLVESKRTEESSIKQTIGKRMESFELNKGHTIRSVLERPFCKVVLDHLVVKDELILKPVLVKSKVDKIMEGWTRKREVVSDLSEDWAHQYWPLDYMYDGTFFDVMCSISFDELSAVVEDLPDGKKHCDKSVLDMLLVLLNFCLAGESERVLMNTHPIALIETARKILSKIFSDRISLACSTFDVLRGDNFSVLKSMTMQSPIFAIGSVVEDALEKNRELWLVLQNMRKAYDLVGWEHLRKNLVRIKMCDRFIRFFGSIYNGRVNRVMTDFGLTDGYCVHDGLDQGEHIFYDSLLYEVKRQDSVYGYRLNSHFISRTGRVDPQAGLFSFLAASVFVDDTIWVGSSQAATQHILDIASEFFRFNNISVNNNKTVAIPINCRVLDPHLTISGASISVAKRGESHYYLGIFLSSEGLSKPSLAKAQADVWFFVNLVLKKAISDKQCAYLVSAVLFPIISYRTQFSFVSVGVCSKWDALVHKVLKSKSGLPRDFPSDALHHPSLYNLKTFEQIQAESKSASIVAFANSTGILGRLFSHRSHDLQVFSWHPHHPLLFPARVGISPSDNFLVGVVRIFSGCDLSLGGPLACAFCRRCGTPMSLVLGEFCFFKCISLLRCYGIAFVEQLRDRNGDGTFKHWKRLDPRGPVPFWFDLSVRFFDSIVPLSSSSSLVDGHAVSDIHFSRDFGVICDTLPTIDAAHLSVYMDGSLSGLGTVNMRAGAAVFFEDINLGLGVGVSGLVSSTLTELQAIALVLECVPFSRSIDLFSDSQTALDACRSESSLVKGHSGVSGNERADALVKGAALSAWRLPHLVSEHFLCAGGTAIGVGSRVVDNSLRADINWSKSFMVWHPDSHLASSFTSMRMAGCCTYFMKALHHRLPVAVYKHLYDRSYPSVVCLFCGDVETSNHVFSCPQDAVSHAHLLGTHASAWEALSGFSRSFSCVLQILASCVSEVGVGVALCKGFVFDEWFCESVLVFNDSKKGAKKIVNFVHEFCLAFRDDVWLVWAKHRVFMKKHGLIPRDGSASASISGLPMVFLAGVVRLLRVAEAFGFGFGFCKFCPFFSGIRDPVSVHIGV
ncbi:hypothetical protein G9A89_008876 [Geosiphon pyriformis]|nr:hypothetical protein G9A89_008876 [Geosiphon pyriformis]